MRARENHVLDSRSEAHIFRGPLTFFYATGNPIVAGRDRRQLWRHFAPNGFRLLPMPGAHGTFHDEPQHTAMVELLRGWLGDELPAGTDTASLFDREFRLERSFLRERVVGSAGDSYRVIRGRAQGYVDVVRSEAGTIHLQGWAVESSLRQPAQTIAAFLGERFIGYGASGLPRPDVAKYLAAPSALNAGFDFYIRLGAAAAAVERPRMFVLSGDGRASELRLRG